MTLMEEASGARPELIVSHRDPGQAARLGEVFRQRGFCVHSAHSGLEVRALAQSLVLPTVVLGTEPLEESGWLTCAKLTEEHPYTKVVLTTPNATARKRRFARFAGAADLVDARAGVSSLVDAVCTAALRAVG